LYGQRQDAAGARARDHLEELADPLASTPLELLEHLQREETLEAAAVEGEHGDGRLCHKLRRGRARRVAIHGHGSRPSAWLVAPRVAKFGVILAPPVGGEAGVAF